MKSLNLFKFFFSIIILIIFIQNIPTASYALDPEEVLMDLEEEHRARNISKNIRCMVCQNQSIDESESPLAKDLRILVRKKITEGLTDREIYKFLTDRYGDFILLKPLIKKNTYPLWFFPIFVFIFGILTLYWYYRKSNYK